MKLVAWRTENFPEASYKYIKNPPVTTNDEKSSGEWDDLKKNPDKESNFIIKIILHTK